MLACQVLLVEACTPALVEMYTKLFHLEKPCVDTRKKTIQVGRNPGRLVVVHEFGAHDECSDSDECPEKIKCKDGCCL
ncbi:hypothetical protein QQG55_28255 [Brugia pahangi]